MLLAAHALELRNIHSLLVFPLHYTCKTFHIRCSHTIITPVFHFPLYMNYFVIERVIY